MKQTRQFFFRILNYLYARLLDQSSTLLVLQILPQRVSAITVDLYFGEHIEGHVEALDEILDLIFRRRLLKIISLQVQTRHVKLDLEQENTSKKTKIFVSKTNDE